MQKRYEAQLQCATSESTSLWPRKKRLKGSEGELDVRAKFAQRRAL
jgi:hypothetical protein